MAINMKHNGNMRGYVICCHGRSGSNLLCEALSETSALGHPREYFHSTAMRVEGADNYPSDPELQINKVKTQGATSNGVYGVKVFPSHLDSLNAFDWISPLPNLTYIHLERIDLLGQAISLVKASQTWQWRSVQKAKWRPYYDELHIKTELVRIARAHARWRLFFARKQIEPLHLVYEDLVKNVDAAVHQIAGRMDVKLVTKLEKPIRLMQKQSDIISEEWRERFLQNNENLVRLDALEYPALHVIRRKVRRLLLRRPEG
jgi:trehalose 2-sulfotransferase